MPLEPLLAAYAGLASLAQATKRHRIALPEGVLSAPAVARAIGVGLLALSLVLAIARFGAAIGPVAWTGQLCLAGGTLVLLMSWRPRLALALALPALAGALVL